MLDMKNQGIRSELRSIIPTYVSLTLTSKDNIQELYFLLAYVGAYKQN